MICGYIKRPFAIWRIWKGQVYAVKILDLDYLLERLTTKTGALDPQRDMVKRLRKCIENGVEHVEYVLKEGNVLLCNVPS